MQIKPTRGELEILAVLWERGPSTVRQVHDELNGRRGRGRDIGYTTILKLMQIMADKGLLARDTSQRSHIYRPAASSSRTRRRLVRDLIERAFEGSASKLVMEALAAKRTSPQDIAELRALLEKIEKEQS